MSPEPTQEPIQESLTASNVTLDARMTNDSDSEDEDMGMTGYIPLSQVSTDADPILDEDEVFERHNNVYFAYCELYQRKSETNCNWNQTFLLLPLFFQNDEWLSEVGESNQAPSTLIVEAHQVNIKFFYRGIGYASLHQFSYLLSSI